MEENRVQGRREFQMIQANVRRIAIQPVVRRAAAAAVENGPNRGAGAVPCVTSLTANPRTLHLLWEEYEHGIAGRKAAKLFTREERGRVKHKYNWRKIVWECIAALVRAGFTAQVAVDRIYQVYGENTTVKKIINKMKQERRAGMVHQSLQV
jgi:hypothetical protein